MTRHRIARAGIIVLALAGCDEGEPSQPPSCIVDGVCAAGETYQYCDDCIIPCPRPAGTPRDYLVNAVEWPTDSRSARTLGLDLDRDGIIDNKLGGVVSLGTSGLALFPTERYEGATPGESIARLIAAGRYLMVVRIYSEDQASTGPWAVQLFSGDHDPTHDATEDNLGGSGHVRIAPGSQTAWSTCEAVGRWAEGYAFTGSGDAQIPYPLLSPSTGVPLLLPLHSARVEILGAVDETGIGWMAIGGGLDRDTVYGVLLPAMIEYTNREIRGNPEGTVAHFALDFFDGCGQIGNAIPGCEGQSEGVGDCAQWTGGAEDPLSLSEVQCNTLLHSALKPDIDVDGDGEHDLLSFGFVVSAIPITIDP
jgi:hypothetical protein